MKIVEMPWSEVRGVVWNSESSMQAYLAHWLATNTVIDRSVADRLVSYACVQKHCTNRDVFFCIEDVYYILTRTWLGAIKVGE